jgi:hypothetical protein
MIGQVRRVAESALAHHHNVDARILSFDFHDTNTF